MDWNWSYRAFRLFDTDVRIHWSLFVVFLYFVLRGATLGYNPAVIALFIVLPMLLLFFSVTCHEFGHVFAARYFGQRTGHMVLTPIGGVVMVAQGRTPWAEFVVAFAGPAVNLALAAIGFFLYFVVGGSSELNLFRTFFGPQSTYAAMISADFVQTNLMLFFFNMLLLAYPMDGGRVLMSALWQQRGFRPALKLSCKIARVVAVGMGIVGLLGQQVTLVLIAFFVFMQANKVLESADYLPDPSGGYYGGGRGAGGFKNPFGFIAKWRANSRSKKIRALLAKAELKGLDSLTPSEREFLNKARELN